MHKKDDILNAMICFLPTDIKDSIYKILWKNINSISNSLKEELITTSQLFQIIQNYKRLYQQNNVITLNNVENVSIHVEDKSCYLDTLLYEMTLCTQNVSDDTSFCLQCSLTEVSNDGTEETIQIKIIVNIQLAHLKNDKDKMKQIRYNWNIMTNEEKDMLFNYSTTDFVSKYQNLFEFILT